MGRGIIVFVASAMGGTACGPKGPPATALPRAAAAPSPGATASPKSSAATPSVPTVDIAVPAGIGGIVFIKHGPTCEAWQFDEAGERLSWIDSPPGAPTLSFRAAVRGPTVVDASAMRVHIGGTSVNVPCDRDEVVRGSAYLEEEDCEAGGRPVVVAGPCLGVVVDAAERHAAVDRAQAEHAAAATAGRQARQAAAREQIARLRKAILGAKGVWRHRADGDGAPTCQQWKRKRDRLVQVGGDAYYGEPRLQLGHAGAVELSMTGPHASGRDGTIGLGSWLTLPISEVTDAYAQVGEERWFFSRAACQAAP